MEFDAREHVYGRDEYYWGTEPNDLTSRIVEYVTCDDDAMTAPRIVDVGAGEGRDTVFFAEQGFDVLATDVSPNGLAKAERLADERGVEIETTVADGNDQRFAEPVDALYSVGSVQYVEPTNRERQFAHFRDRTTAGGVHVVFAFVDHPDVPTPTDWTENEHFYAPGELADYYADWQLLEEDSIVFPDDSGDEPHEHAAEIVVARKPDRSKRAN